MHFELHGGCYTDAVDGGLESFHGAVLNILWLNIFQH